MDSLIDSVIISFYKHNIILIVQEQLIVVLKQL